MSAFTCASRAEAIDTLVFIFEERGIFVTPADVEPLAVRVVTERADGVAVFECTVSELLTLAREFIPLMGERADCPLTWCTGERTAHASLDPGEWEHESENDELAPYGMLFGAIRQIGEAAPSYALDVNSGAQAPPLTAADVRGLADAYARHAIRLRDRAAALAELGSTP